MNQLIALLKKRHYTLGCGKTLLLQLIMPVYIAFVTALACHFLPYNAKSGVGILIGIEMACGMSMASSNTIG